MYYQDTRFLSHHEFLCIFIFVSSVNPDRHVVQQMLYGARGIEKKNIINLNVDNC